MNRDKLSVEQEAENFLAKSGKRDPAVSQVVEQAHADDLSWELPDFGGEDW